MPLETGIVLTTALLPWCHDRHTVQSLATGLYLRTMSFYKPRCHRLSKSRRQVRAFATVTKYSIRSIFNRLPDIPYQTYTRLLPHMVGRGLNSAVSLQSDD